MRTQSRDTSPEAERVLIGLIRNASIAKRFKLIRSMTTTFIQMNVRNIQKLYPHTTSDEIAKIFVSRSDKPDLQAWVESLGVRLKNRHGWTLSEYDILVALNSIAAIFEKQDITYYISGSLASSIYGMQQLTQDLDVVADLQVAQVPHLTSLLQEDYHFDTQEMYTAIQQHTSFSMFHLDTLLKVDIIIPRSGPFESQVSRRLHWHLLDEASCRFPITSPEDIILIKLAHHRKTEIFPDDQWNDILGVLKVQGSDLDLTYLEKWAAHLEVTNLFDLACIDAGLKE